MQPLPRLAILVLLGGLIYAGWLAVFAREAVADLVGMIRKRR
jgi:hypothetical protein